MYIKCLSLKSKRTLFFLSEIFYISLTLRETNSLYEEDGGSLNEYHTHVK